MEIVVFDESEFALGFELAGSRAVAPGDDPDAALARLLDDKAIGILLLSRNTFLRLSPELQERLQHTLQPVSVVLSDGNENEELRNLIIKSIGVDLWTSEE